MKLGICIELVKMTQPTEPYCHSFQVHRAYFPNPPDVDGCWWLNPNDAIFYQNVCQLSRYGSKLSAGSWANLLT